MRETPGAVRGTMASPDEAFIWQNDGAYLYSTKGGPGIRVFEWPLDDRDYHAITVTENGDLIVRSYDLILHLDRDADGSISSIDTLAHIPEIAEFRGRPIAAASLDLVWIGFWE